MWLLASLPLVLGTAVGLAVRADVQSAWYKSLEKPSWMPPAAAFGPVWTVLYVLMGLAAARVAMRAGPNRSGPLALFAVQLALNLAWSIVFFRWKNIRAALLNIVVLWGVLVTTTAAFASVDALAAGMMVPYVAWVTLATALTAEIWRRNPWAVR